MIGTMGDAPVIVLGATGRIGRAVVDAALAARMPVVAVARDLARLAALHRAHPDARLATIACELRHDCDGLRLARGVERALRRLTPAQAAPRGVVDALALPALRGRVLDRAAGVLADALDVALTSRLAAARHLLPMLGGDGRGYVIVGGPGDQRPWAGYGHRSIASGALRMLAAVLHEEARPRGQRVQLLAVDTPVRGDMPRADTCPQWACAADVGVQALALLDPARERIAAPVVAFEHRPRATHAPSSADPCAGGLRDVRQLLSRFAFRPSG